MLLRTDSSNHAFQALVKELDQDLALRDGQEHGFYAQYNKIDHLKFVVVLFEKDQPVSCGAFKELADKGIEIKRMFTLPNFRGRGFALQVLNTLETWAREMNHENAVLETGKKQPEAISLYEKAGYKNIPNYGPYVGIENSLCFGKKLR